jgi:hypothetical protein
MNTLFLIDHQAKTWEIDKNTGWTVGRDPTNSMVLSDIKVSRKHAVVRWEKGEFVVRDLNSRNGTFVNSQRIESTGLSNGDVLRFGNTELLVRIGSQQLVEEELVNQKQQMSVLDTYMDFEDEFRVHESGFSGNLKTLSMVEVVQTIMQFGKDGLLEIRDSDDSVIANAWFLNGEIVHAEFDRDIGVQAMYRIVNLDTGIFEFQNDRESPVHTIEQSTMSILLEACKQMDEAGRKP